MNMVKKGRAGANAYPRSLPFLQSLEVYCKAHQTCLSVGTHPPTAHGDQSNGGNPNNLPFYASYLFAVRTNASGLNGAIPARKNRFDAAKVPHSAQSYVYGNARVPSRKAK
ncbi:predicted protein [Postia placenta Mad-698-R]|uniref:Uncharacterized protein n=1 Tax=Postia placenta MAD-698-R-SB12 TaxID=670580 RepID=A0A1X6N9Y5_9APHY|nr:hypothetical protein POSPLADRAFT_1044573 [Postia placenta MAD-698-R-SB12]EED79047.1 predicted protein [Postia placenta Mad-698-R]OSX65163.1 hypothetical protein POSPLADRAFT_1044573 [Postia placenta MAD-698-R-SB12]